MPPQAEAVCPGLPAIDVPSYNSSNEPASPSRTGMVAMRSPD